MKGENAMKDALRDMLTTLDSLRNDLENLYSAAVDDDELSSWICHIENHIYEATGGIEFAIKRLDAVSAQKE